MQVHDTTRCAPAKRSIGLTSNITSRDCLFGLCTVCLRPIRSRDVLSGFVVHTIVELLVLYCFTLRMISNNYLDSRNYRSNWKCKRMVRKINDQIPGDIKQKLCDMKD